MSEEKKVLNDEELEDVSGGIALHGSRGPVCTGGGTLTDGNCLEAVPVFYMMNGKATYSSCQVKGTKEACEGCQYNV